MTNGDFIKLIVKDLKEYCKTDILSSIIRNDHMNEFDSSTQPHPSQEAIDAILVDFVNFVGMQRGMDLGLYTEDIKND